MRIRIVFPLRFITFFVMLLIIIVSNVHSVEWVEMDSGTTYPLAAAWGSSSTDIFIVGSFGIILHYDGNPEGTWSLMDNKSA